MTSISSAASARRLIAPAVVALVLVPAVPGAGGGVAAHAEQGVHDYVECPVIQRGAGCGFEALVPAGSWIVVFRYRDANGAFRSEIDSGTCTQAECPALTFAVPRIDRTPAGYDVFTSAPIVGPRTFVRF